MIAAKRALALALLLAAASSACSSKKREPVGGKSSAGAVDAGAQVAGDSGASAKPPEEHAAPPWQRKSAPLELECDAKPAAKEAGKAATPAAPAVRTLPRAELVKDCQDQPSIDAACACLAQSPAAGMVTGQGSETSCQPYEMKPAAGERKPRSQRGQLVSVRGRSGPRDTLDSGETLVLLVQRGATWSALQVVDGVDEVDREETPRTSNTAEVRRYEELPFGGGTLFWVQTSSESSDVVAGDSFVEGTAALTLCAEPAPPAEGAKIAPWCTRLPLGEWNYTAASGDGADERRCEVRKAVEYRVTLDDRGQGAVTIERGVDEQSLVGRFQL